MYITSKTTIKTSDKILRKAMYEVFDGKCFYTGRDIPFEKIHIDHIDPDGGDCIENYVLCCSYINIKKGNKKDENFIKRIKEINKLLFVKNVVNEYNNILINNGITAEFIEINEFFKQNKITDEREKNKWRQKFRRKLKGFKIKIGKQTEGKLYYKKKEIRDLLASQNIKRFALIGSGRPKSTLAESRH